MPVFRKKSACNAMREYFGTPSFLYAAGSSWPVTSPDDVKSIIGENAGKGVFFIPSPAVLESPRKWCAAFSMAPYLVILGDRSIREFSVFMKLVERIVFSPVPKKLSAVFMVGDREKAMELLAGAGFSQQSIMELRAVDGGEA